MLEKEVYVPIAVLFRKACFVELERPDLQYQTVSGTSGVELGR